MLYYLPEYKEEMHKVSSKFPRIENKCVNFQTASQVSCIFTYKMHKTFKQNQYLFLFQSIRKENSSVFSELKNLVDQTYKVIHSTFTDR